MPLPTKPVVEAVDQIAREVARSHAAAVDADARFPAETFAALKEASVLGAAVPVELGGGGAGTEELALITQRLSEQCASSGMILAMHFIQVASIANHRGGVPEIEDYLRRVAAEQRLIASATSEVGPSGDMRRSECAVERKEDRFQVVKQATTISYGKFADDILLTARRTPESQPNDQVAVLALRDGFSIESKGSWDTLGMRGTCSPGGELSVQGELWQVLPTPFAEIASESMVPHSHIFWGGCWLGIATDAVNRARASVRAAARKNPSEMPPAATALADVVVKLNRMRSEVRTAAGEQAELEGANRSELSTMAYALRTNGLKLSASTQVVEIVTEALRICGIRAYKNDSEFSLGRHLRDAHSAALMINNDRIRATNAALLLVAKGN